MTLKRYVNCMEVQEDFSALLDNELTLEERERIEGHLSECAECLRELDALKQVDVAYSALSTVKAPEDFEEGVRQAIRPRTLRFPALGGARSMRWMRPAAAMAALLLVMFGAIFALQPSKLGLPETERFQLADSLEEDMPALGAEIGATSPIASKPAETPAFDLKDEGLELEEASSEAAADDKRDVQLVDLDNAREVFVRQRLDAPEEKEGAKGVFRGQTNAPQRKAESSLEAAGGLGDSGAAVSERRRVAKAAAPSSDGPGAPAQKPKSLSNSLDDFALPERGIELQSADAAQVMTPSEALRQRAEVIGQPPFNEERADVELRKRVLSEQRENYFRGRAGDVEQILPKSFEDLLERDLDRMAPVKTVPVRSYNVGADGIWVEVGYDGEPTTILKRGSKELEALLELDPDVKKVAQRPARTIFQAGGRWYTLEAEEEE